MDGFNLTARSAQRLDIDQAKSAAQPAASVTGYGCQERHQYQPACIHKLHHWHRPARTAIPCWFRIKNVPCSSKGVAQPNNHDLGLEIALPSFKTTIPLMMRTTLQINHQNSNGMPIKT